MQPKRFVRDIVIPPGLLEKIKKVSLDDLRFHYLRFNFYYSKGGQRRRRPDFYISNKRYMQSYSILKIERAPRTFCRLFPGHIEIFIALTEFFNYEVLRKVFKDINKEDLKEALLPEVCIGIGAKNNIEVLLKVHCYD